MQDNKLNELEAAILIGFSPDLLKFFTANSAKTGEKRLLKYTLDNGLYVYERKELLQYSKYLHDKWPPPSQETRAHIPDAIKSEIRRHANFQCSICTYQHNLEVAHIDSWADSKRNHPHNLILLCPNHHSQYDFGFKLHASLKVGDVRLLRQEQISARKLEWQCRLKPLQLSEQLANLLQNITASLKEKDSIDKAEIQRIIEQLRPEIVSELAIGRQNDNARTRHEELANIFEVLNRAEALGNRGQVLSNQKHYALAKSLIEEALHLQLSVLDDDHAMVADSRCCLGFVLAQLQSYDEAEEMLSMGFKVRKTSLHPFDFGLAVVMTNLGNVYANRNKLQEAENMYEIALEITSKTKGKDDIFFFSNQMNLAKLYQKNQKIELAEPLYEQAIKGAISQLTDTHPLVKLMKENLHQCLSLKTGD